MPKPRNHFVVHNISNPKIWLSIRIRRFEGNLAVSVAVGKPRYPLRGDLYRGNVSSKGSSTVWQIDEGAGLTMPNRILGSVNSFRKSERYGEKIGRDRVQTA